MLFQFILLKISSSLFFKLLLKVLVSFYWIITTKTQFSGTRTKIFFKTAPIHPKMPQDNPQIAHRPPQDHPKTPQDHPETAPRRPKTTPRPPKDHPKRPLGRSRAALGPTYENHQKIDAQNDRSGLPIASQNETKILPKSSQNRLKNEHQKYIDVWSFVDPKTDQKTYQNHTPKRCQNHIKKDPNFKMHFKVRMQIPNLNCDRVIRENRAPA